jgi:hypothetical protein
VAVKPEKMLRLLQELDEWPARAWGGCAASDPALGYCVGLWCERLDSDQKWFWLARSFFHRCPAIGVRFLREVARAHGFELIVQMRDIECDSYADAAGK